MGQGLRAQSGVGLCFSSVREAEPCLSLDGKDSVRGETHHQGDEDGDEEAAVQLESQGRGLVPTGREAGGGGRQGRGECGVVCSLLPFSQCKQHNRQL